VSLGEPLPPNPVALRYVTEPFPSYRFIPGVNPHPTRDPKGHSFGRVPHQKTPFLPHDWANNLGYLYGVDLYNAAYWWESHEAWEELWQPLVKESLDAQFLQGLIQISASFIKWHMQDELGLKKLFSLGISRLESVKTMHPQFMGIDLSSQIEIWHAHFHTVIQTGDTSINPVHDYPFLVLNHRTNQP